MLEIGGNRTILERGGLTARTRRSHCRRANVNIEVVAVSGSHAPACLSAGHLLLATSTLRYLGNSVDNNHASSQQHPYGAKVPMTTVQKVKQRSCILVFHAWHRQAVSLCGILKPKFNARNEGRETTCAKETAECQFVDQSLAGDDFRLRFPQQGHKDPTNKLGHQIAARFCPPLSEEAIMGLESWVRGRYIGSAHSRDDGTGVSLVPRFVPGSTSVV